MKKFKKSIKKQLTKEKESGNMYKLSARESENNLKNAKKVKNF